MMMAWQIVGGVVVVYLTSFVIGFPLTLWLFKRTGLENDEGATSINRDLLLSVIAAPVTGFYLAFIITYLVMLVTKTGTDEIARPVFFLLLVLSLMLSAIQLRGKLTILATVGKIIPYLLPLVFLAPYSILYPLFSHPGAVVWYSDGTDGARY